MSNTPKKVKRSRILKAYFRDFVGCTENPCTQEMREEAHGLYNEASEIGLARAVKQICFECVGGDADPGPRLRVRDCTCQDCHLHPIRPWKDVVNRSARSKAARDRI